MRKAARKAGLLEVSNEDHRTRNLHTGLTFKPKTNILGEVVDRGPLARLLRKQAVLNEKKKKKAAAKKTAVKPSKKKATCKKKSKK